MNCPKISIITPSYNQGDFLEKNILAVLNQQYANFEHIIIDGGSTDKTLEILKRYSHLKWISVRDKGQADALNKGLKMSTGDIIGWINSDDFYEENIFQSLSEYFTDENTNWIVGYLKQINFIKGTAVKVGSPKIDYASLIKNPDIVRQPCTFFRKRIIEHAGAWNEDLHMVMDFDLWIRLAKICEPKMVDMHLANFVIHSNQKTNVKNIKKQIREILYILKKEQAPKTLILNMLFRKYKSYYKQKIKSLLSLPL